MFRPLDPDANYSIGRPLESLAPSCIKLSFVPRQKFYIVKYVDREVLFLVGFHFVLYPFQFYIRVVGMNLTMYMDTAKKYLRSDYILPLA